MAVDQRKLIAVLHDAVDKRIERYSGYRKDLLDHVAQIVMLEREHERRATQIQKKVSDKVEALGILIAKREESVE
jgi:hypothetical protein